MIIYITTYTIIDKAFPKKYGSISICNDLNDAHNIMRYLFVIGLSICIIISFTIYLVGVFRLQFKGENNDANNVYMRIQ